MHRFLFISITFLLMLTNLQGQWEILNEGGDFESIEFVNDQVGWIAGSGTLLKTENEI